jgi:hypothetical protein
MLEYVAVDVDSMMMKYSDLGLTDKQSSKTTQQQQHHQHRESMAPGNVVPHHPIVQPPMPHQFGRLPQWLNADALLPDLYHGVANMCCRCAFIFRDYSHQLKVVINNRFL